MYHNGGPLTNTITNKTELYALRDRSLMVIHTPELILSIGCLTPAKGDGGGASSMYNAPQNLLAKIQDKVRTLSEA